MPKITSVKSVSSLITKLIVLLTTIVTLLLITFFVFIKYKQIDNLNNQNKSIIESNIALFKSNISEKLSMIASSRSFMDYLRSGEESRKRLYSDFALDLSNFHDESIKGFMIESTDNKNNNLIYDYGDKTPYSVAVNLCYLDNSLNQQYGNCTHIMYIYFDRKYVFDSLVSINPSIKECSLQSSSCQQFNVFKNNDLGNFKIENHRNLSLDLTIPVKVDIIIYIGIFLLFITIILLAALAITILNKAISKYIGYPLNSLIDDIKEKDFVKKNFRLMELSYLYDEIVKREEKVNAALIQENKLRIAKIATQAAHDIRNPLTTILYLIESENITNDQNKMLIKEAGEQINDIANGLLTNYARKPALNTVVYDVINCIISIMQVNYKDYSFVVSYPERDVFRAVTIEYGILKRCISNIVINAVEAVSARKEKKINIKYYIVDNFLCICIQDNGVGTDVDLVDRVKHGDIQSTKKHGSGIGLEYVINNIESCNGKVEIFSEKNVGTNVALYLKTTTRENIYVDTIDLSKYKRIFVIDDDDITYKLWKTRFPDGNQLSYFPDFNFEGLDSDSHLYLIDYDLKSSLSGIDFIVKNNLQKCSYLVTNMAFDENIYKECLQNNINVIPKSFISHICIKVDKKQRELVLIDDEELIRDIWSLSMKKMGVVLHSFSNDIEFMRKYNDFNKNINIYIDYNFNNSAKNGIEIAIEIHNLGFENIFIITGHTDLDDVPAFVKAILGKSPPRI